MIIKLLTEHHFEFLSLKGGLNLTLVIDVNCLILGKLIQS